MSGRLIDKVKSLNLVLSQTNYTEDEAKEKLELFNNDYMKVLKEYLRIPEQKEKINSVNQEIFKQMRKNLDVSMKEYRKQNPIDIHQVIDNFNESDERKT